jgi:hypothetical protein
MGWLLPVKERIPRKVIRVSANKPLLTVDDDLQNVWVADNNMIEGLFMFKRSHLTEEIGMFERLFDNTGFEQVVFSLKFSFIN